jgi:hypothetical protein
MYGEMNPDNAKFPNWLGISPPKFGVRTIGKINWFDANPRYEIDRIDWEWTADGKSP